MFARCAEGVKFISIDDTLKLAVEKNLEILKRLISIANVYNC